jgi:hypothetical protein
MVTNKLAPTSPPTSPATEAVLAATRIPSGKIPQISGAAGLRPILPDHCLPRLTIGLTGKRSALTRPQLDGSWFFISATIELP